MFLPGLSPNVANVNWNNFIDVYEGQLIAALERASVTMRYPIERVKSFPMGARSEQFMVHGRTTGLYQQRGASMLIDTQSSGSPAFLDTLPSTPVNVFLDRPFVRPFFLDANDEYQSHWPEVPTFVKQAAEAMARRRDYINFLLIARAAFRTDGGVAAADKTYLSGLKATGATAKTYIEGTVVDADTDAANFLSTNPTVAGPAIEAILKKMRDRFYENHVSESESLYMFCRPATVTMILTSMAEYVEDYSTPGNGSLADGRIAKVLGWHIIPTTNLPSSTNTNLADQSGAGSSGTANDYRHNATNLAALFCTNDVIGRCHMGATGLKFDSSYEKDRNGRAYYNQYTGGAVELRPEACGAVATTGVTLRNSA